MHGDDLQQLDAGMLIYDALYRWCREAVAQTHTWVGANEPRKPVDGAQERGASGG